MQNTRSGAGRSPLAALWVSVARSAGRVVWRSYTGANSGILFAALLITVAIFGVLLRDEGFFTVDNLLNIVRLSATITVMAVATVFVISAGEIDLSIASVIPVAALIAAVLMAAHWPFLLAALVAIAFGAAVGLVNGVITVGFGIPSFVVTLGMLGILQGLSQMITHTVTISISDAAFLFWFGVGQIGPIPILDIWSLAAFIVGAVVLSWTALGRRVLATGANRNAARFSGIRTGRIRVGVMVFSAIAGAIAGLLYDGQFGAAEFTTGQGDLLTVIAAAIIGGTLLAGGKGSVLGAVVGSLLMALLNNALILINLGAPEQLIVRGIIIVIAVMVSSRQARTREAWRWLARLDVRDATSGTGRPGVAQQVAASTPSEKVK
jgi:ribose transport system permease protein